MRYCRHKKNLTFVSLFAFSLSLTGCLKLELTDINADIASKDVTAVAKVSQNWVTQPEVQADFEFMQDNGLPDQPPILISKEMLKDSDGLWRATVEYSSSGTSAVRAFDKINVKARGHSDSSIISPSRDASDEMSIIVGGQPKLRFEVPDRFSDGDSGPLYVILPHARRVDTRVDLEIKFDEDEIISATLSTFLINIPANQTRSFPFQLIGVKADPTPYGGGSGVPGSCSASQRLIQLKARATISNENLTAKKNLCIDLKK